MSGITAHRVWQISYRNTMAANNHFSGCYSNKFFNVLEVFSLNRGALYCEIVRRRRHQSIPYLKIVWVRKDTCLYFPRVLHGKSPEVTILNVQK